MEGRLVRHLLNLASYAELDITHGRALRLASAVWGEAEFTVAFLRGAYGLATVSVEGHLIDGPVSISAERALDALPIIKARSEVTATVSPSALTLAVEGSRLRLRRIPEDDDDVIADAIAALTAPGVLTVPFARWSAAFGRALSFAATDYNQPVLTGVHLFEQDDGLVLEACNGFSTLYRETLTGDHVYARPGLDVILAPGGERRYAHLLRDGREFNFKLLQDAVGHGRLFARGAGAAYHWPRLSGQAPAFAFPETVDEGWVTLPDMSRLAAAREAIGAASVVTLDPVEGGVRLSLDATDDGAYEELIAGDLPTSHRLYVEPLIAIARALPAPTRLQFGGFVAIARHEEEGLGSRTAYVLTLPSS